MFEDPNFASAVSSNSILIASTNRGNGSISSSSSRAGLGPNSSGPSLHARLGSSRVVDSSRPFHARGSILATDTIGPSGSASSSIPILRVGTGSLGSLGSPRAHPSSQDCRLIGEVMEVSAASSILANQSVVSQLRASSASSSVVNGPPPEIRAPSNVDPSVDAERLDVLGIGELGFENAENLIDGGLADSIDSNEEQASLSGEDSNSDFLPDDAPGNANLVLANEEGDDSNSDSDYRSGEESPGSSEDDNMSYVDEADALLPNGLDLLEPDDISDLLAYFNKPIYQLHNKAKVTLACLTKKLMGVAVEDDVRRDRVISALLLAPGLYQASKRHEAASHTAIFRSFLLSAVPEDEMMSFAIDLRERLGPKKRMLMSKLDVAKANAKIEKLLRDNLLSKAMAIVDSIDVDPSVLSDQEKQDKVESLHPEATYEDILEPSQGHDQPDLTLQEVYDALLKAPKVSAAGVSGFTFAFLHTLFSGKDFAPTHQCLDPLVNFLNLVMKGNVSPFALGLLIAGRLVLLPKLDGGIRPVNVGEALLRLIGRIINVREAVLASAGFAPHQLAVGISGAGEKMARVTQAAFDSGLGILAADAPNAFNGIRRQFVQAGLRLMAPSVESWFVRTHSGQATLRDSSGRRLYLSSTGVRQGDPLGMLFYSAAIHRGLVLVSDHMKDTYPDSEGLTDVRGLGYADDLAILGDVDHLIAETEEIKRILNTVGYTMSIEKSRILCRTATEAQHDGSSIDITNAHRIMGVPIGSEDDVKRLASQSVHEAGLSFVNLEKVASRQTALALTTYCVNTRPTYLTRTVHPSLLQDSLTTFDDSCDRLLSKLAGATLSVDAKAIRGLSIGLGGMSIHRHAGPKSHFAYLSGRALSANYLDSHYGFADDAGGLTSLPVPESYSHLGILQPPSKDIKSAQNQILGGLVATFRASGEDDKAAWLLSGSKPTSDANNTTCSGWWCLWSGGTDYRRAFQDHVLQGAIRQRLLLPSLPEGIHCAMGHQDHRNSALHPLHCPQLWGGLGTLRHNAVRDALFTLIKECLEPSKGDLILEYQIPNAERRADILLKARGRAGQPATTYLIDVTVTSPACEAALEKGAQRDPMVAANLAEEGKNRDYEPLVASRHIAPPPRCIIVPFGVEANGRLGDSAASWIDRITKGGEVEHPAKRALFAKTCSYAIAKYGSLMAWSNAEAANRVAPLPPRGHANVGLVGS